MNDLPSLARQARANLSQALSALQEDTVPPKTQALASVVAEAMNLLHRIEKNTATPEFDCWDHATRALLLVRTALNNLQSKEHSHPSIEGVLEPAAQAVGLVHKLNQLAAAHASEPPKADSIAPTDPAPVVQSPETLAPTPVASPSSASAHESSPENATPGRAVTHPPSSTADSPVNDTSAADTSGTGTSRADDSAADTATADKSGAPTAAAENQASEIPSAGASTSPPQAAALGSSAVSETATDSASLGSIAPQERPSVSPERPSASPDRPSVNPDRPSTSAVTLPALEPLPGEVYIEVALSAYSTSNFYRPVREADVVDAGGLFVASYTPPELAENVRVRATLSSGYSFEARGTVEWRREMPKSGSLNPLTPPGFGLRFTELSAEARKIVSRYARSREPLLRAADAAE